MKYYTVPLQILGHSNIWKKKEHSEAFIKITTLTSVESPIVRSGYWGNKMFSSGLEY